MLRPARQAHLYAHIVFGRRRRGRGMVIENGRFSSERHLATGKDSVPAQTAASYANSPS
jgi:hypothetical protein